MQYFLPQFTFMGAFWSFLGLDWYVGLILGIKGILVFVGNGGILVIFLSSEVFQSFFMFNGVFW